MYVDVFITFLLRFSGTIRPLRGLVVPVIEERGRYYEARVAGFVVPPVATIPGIIGPRSGPLMLGYYSERMYYRARYAGLVVLSLAVIGRNIRPRRGLIFVAIIPRGSAIMPA